MKFFVSETSVPKERLYSMQLLGANGADPTETISRGVDVTRTAEGVYKITFTENPGTFIGVRGYCFGADTPADVKGYTLTRDTFDTTGGVYSLSVSVWDSTFAAADIIAAQYLDLTLAFSELVSP